MFVIKITLPFSLVTSQSSKGKFSHIFTHFTPQYIFTSLPSLRWQETGLIRYSTQPSDENTDRWSFILFDTVASAWWFLHRQTYERDLAEDRERILSLQVWNSLYKYI